MMPVKYREIYILTLARMLLSFSYTMSAMFIPLYLLEIKKLSAGLVGTLSGITTLFGLTGWLAAGSLIRKYTEIHLVVTTLYLRAIIYFFTGISIYFDVPYGWILVFNFLNHFLMGIVISPVESLVMNLSGEEDRNLAISIHRVGMNIGWSAGPLLGGILVSYHYSYPLFLTSAITFLTALMIKFTIRYRRKPQVITDRQRYGLRDVMKNKKFFVFAMNSLNLFITMSLLVTPLSVFLTEHYRIPKIELGKLYFLNGIMVVILQVPVSLLVKDLKLSSQLGLLLYFAGFSMIGWYSPEMPLSYLYLSIVIVTAGEILSVSPFYALASYYAKEKSVEEDITNFYVSSILGFLRSLGWAIGPVVAGWIQEMFSGTPELIWVLSSSFALFAILINLIVFRRS